MDAPAGEFSFGYQVCLSGTTLAVSSNLPPGPSGEPKVFFHERDAGGANNWGLVATRQADQNSGGLGYTLDVEGELAAVSVPGENAIYLFARDQSGPAAWGFLKKISSAAATNYGGAVALGSDGALAVAGDLGTASPFVHILRRNIGGPNNWGIERTIPAPATAGISFPRVLALEDDVLLASAPLRTVSAKSEAGSVYVFQRNKNGPNVWGLLATLSSPEAIAGGQFGIAADFDGNTFAISASLHSAAFDDPACFVFERTPGASPEFQHVQTFAESGEPLTAPLPLDNVSVSGETILFGNPAADAPGGITNSGRGLLIERLAGCWARVASPGAEQVAAGMEFGAALAMEGDLLAVGAPGYDNVLQGGADAGAVFVFTRSNDSWTLQKKIEGGSLTQFRDHFGSSVALRGDTLAVGAPGRVDLLGNVTRTGEVYIFRQHVADSFDWGEIKRLAEVPANNRPGYGAALALDENWLAVGYTNGGTGGQVFVHLRNRTGADQWATTQTIDNPAEASEASGDLFGHAMAISGSFMMIGAPFAEGRKGIGAQEPVAFAGRAYLYEVQQGGANRWERIKQLPIVQIANTPFGEAGGNYGWSVAMQGTQIAVGAPGESADRGRVHINERTEGVSTVTWGRVAVVEVPADYPIQDLGASVAIQDDTVVAAAAWSNELGLDSAVACAFIRNKGGIDEYGFDGVAAHVEIQSQNAIGGRAVAPSRIAVWGRQLALGSPSPLFAGAASGHVDVFFRQSDRWGLSRTLPDPTSYNSNSAHVVDIHTERAAVGYFFTLDDPSVFILERNTGGIDRWGVVKKISEAGTDAAGFPASLSLWGRYLAIGAPSADSLGYNGNGAVFLYEQNTPSRNGWGYILRIPGGQDDERFGGNVALEGDRLLIGASGYDSDASHLNAGAAYVYERNDDSAPQWNFVRRILSDPPTAGARFGRSIALDADVAAIGAPNHGNAGRVFLHRRNQGGSGQWGESAFVGNPVSGGVSYGSLHIGLSGGWLVAGSLKDGGASQPWGVAVTSLASEFDPDPPIISFGTRALEFPAGTIEGGAMQDISGGTVVASNSQSGRIGKLGTRGGDRLPSARIGRHQPSDDCGRRPQRHPNLPTYRLRLRFMAAAHLH
ncbi:MAG: hypothetical protein ACR2OZ_04330 [Verrucomicrobiales bacterium]